MKLKRIYYYVFIVLILVCLLVYLGKFKETYSKNSKVVMLEEKPSIVESDDIKNDVHDIVVDDEVLDENSEIITRYYYVELIKPSKGKLRTSFRNNIYEYDLDIDKDVNSLGFDLVGYGLLDVNGIDEQQIDEYETKRIINISFKDGSNLQYVFNVHKRRSNDASIRSIKSSYGVIDYFDGKSEYELVVSDNIKKVSFDVETNDALAIVKGNKDIGINYGLNRVQIDVVAQDEITINSVIINVIRQKEIKDINVLCDDLLIDIGDEVSFGYEIVPSDSSFRDVLVYSDNNDIVRIEDNKITGVSYGSVSVHFVSNHNNNIDKVINVVVTDKKIHSDRYDIYRDDFNYIIGLEPETKVEDFIVNINDEVRLFKSNGDEIVDGETIIGTGMVMKKYIDNDEVDTLTIVVRGDLTGNGYVLMSDYTKANNYINGTIELEIPFLKAIDVTKDGIIDKDDSKMIYDYLLMKINSLN